MLFNISTDELQEYLELSISYLKKILFASAFQTPKQCPYCQEYHVIQYKLLFSHSQNMANYLEANC